MKEQASIRAGRGGRLAMIRIRIQVKNMPRGAEVSVTDVMLQPGGASSGWIPHVTELPWSAGVTP